MPVIDDVSDKHFGYEVSDGDHDRGGLDGKLLHFWIGNSGSFVVQGQLETDAFPTPTMIGRKLFLYF